MSADREAWLAANTFACQRLAARITRQACADFRAENLSSRLASNCYAGMTMPGCCQDCPQAVLDLPVTPKKENEMGAKGKCVDCGREMSLRSHGRCGKCFPKAVESGAVPPAKKHGPAPYAGRQKTAKRQPATDGSAVLKLSDAGRPGELAEIMHLEAGTGIYVCFDIRDQGLLEKLEELAAKQRRTLPAQILFLLEKVVITEGVFDGQ